MSSRYSGYEFYGFRTRDYLGPKLENIEKYILKHCSDDVKKVFFDENGKFKAENLDDVRDICNEQESIYSEYVVLGMGIRDETGLKVDIFCDNSNDYEDDYCVGIIPDYPFHAPEKILSKDETDAIMAKHVCAFFGIDKISYPFEYDSAVIYG